MRDSRRNLSRSKGQRNRTGAPCSPQRTWAENGFFQCFHSMRTDSCSWPQSFRHTLKRREGLRPVFFGPCTLGRTWGTRPGKRASLGRTGESGLEMEFSRSLFKPLREKPQEPLFIEAPHSPLSSRQEKGNGSIESGCR